MPSAPTYSCRSRKRAACTRPMPHWRVVFLFCWHCAVNRATRAHSANRALLRPGGDSLVRSAIRWSMREIGCAIANVPGPVQAEVEHRSRFSTQIQSSPKHCIGSFEECNEGR